jgi:hypothetical protein
MITRRCGVIVALTMSTQVAIHNLRMHPQLCADHFPTNISLRIPHQPCCDTTLYVACSRSAPRLSSILLPSRYLVNTQELPCWLCVLLACLQYSESMQSLYPSSLGVDQYQAWRSRRALTILRQETCQSSTCRSSSDNQEICLNRNRSTLQDSWRLAIVLDLSIRIGLLKFRHGDAIGNIKEERREQQKICQWQIVSTILKEGQVTGLRDAFQWCVMVGVAAEKAWSTLVVFGSFPRFVFPRNS